MAHPGRTGPRAGYTLLEVLVASAIAALLLAALYVALDTAMIRMDTGRDQVGGNDFARALFNRIGADLQASLGPLQPKSGGGTPMDPASTSGSTPTGGTTTGGTGTNTTGTGSNSTTGSSGTSGSTSGSTTASASDTGSTEGTAVASDLPFQGGVFGTNKSVSVFLSRVPTALIDPAAAADPESIHSTDLRKVTYYQSSTGALCRQERPWVTADGVRNSLEPDSSTEAFDVIAPEVVDATFEYYDGGTWQGSWDGSMTGLDGVTPVGPPRAIRVTLVLEFPGRSGAMVQKRVTQVIPLRAAIGDYVPPTDAATDPATTGTPTTGGM
jgi:prepilin-type N-terminal cleavage/methylation domain-containing protein